MHEPQLYQNISDNFHQLYKETLDNYGYTTYGMGWESDYAANVRHNRMLQVIDNLYDIPKPSILYVGCGCAYLLDYCRRKKIDISYTGMDILEQSIEKVREKYPEVAFIVGDVTKMECKAAYDYVICNGILTYKNTVGIREMDQYFKLVVKNLFNACKVGIAFNVTSTYSPYLDNRNFYKHPLELLSFCLENLGASFKLDHSFRGSDQLHDYVLYAYKSETEIVKNGIRYNANI